MNDKGNQSEASLFHGFDDVKGDFSFVGGQSIFDEIGDVSFEVRAGDIGKGCGVVADCVQDKSSDLNLSSDHVFWLGVGEITRNGVENYSIAFLHP